MANAPVKQANSTEQRLIVLTQERDKEFIDDLKPFSNESQVSLFSLGTGDQTNNQGLAGGNFLPISGGVMAGPIGFNPLLAEIVSNEIDVAKTTGLFTGRLILGGEAGDLNDILERITGNDNQIPGRMLSIQGIDGETITFKHQFNGGGGGDIRTPNESDFILDGERNITLIYDAVNDEWTFMDGGLINVANVSDRIVADDSSVIVIDDGISDGRVEVTTDGTALHMRIGLVGGQKTINIQSSELTNVNVLRSPTTNQNIDSISGGWRYEVPTGGAVHQFRVHNGTIFVEVGHFDAGGLNMDDLNISNVSGINFSQTGVSINDTATNMELGVPADQSVILSSGGGNILLAKLDGGQKTLDFQSSEIINFNVMFSGAAGSNKRIDSVVGGFSFDAPFGQEHQFRVRNSGDTAWVNVGTFDQGGFKGENLPIAEIASISFTNGGAISNSATNMIFAIGAGDNFQWTIGTVQMTLTDSNLNLLGSNMSEIGIMRINEQSVDPTVPVSLVNEGQLYAKDVSGNTELFWRRGDDENISQVTNVTVVPAITTMKTSVRIATQVNDSLSGLAARDGITPVAGDRVLVKAQSTASANGIYVAASGAWTRATDYDTDVDATSGSLMLVQEGTVNDNKAFQLTTNEPITLGTTSLTFAEFGAGGGGSSFTDAAFDVHDEVTPAKIFQFNLGGLANGTTTFDINNTIARIYTFPDATGTMAMLNLAQVWTAQQTFNSAALRIADNFLRLRNPANTQLYNFRTSAITIPIDVKLPLLIADDTFAFIGSTQTWTALQTHNANINMNNNLIDNVSAVRSNAANQPSVGIYRAGNNEIIIAGRNFLDDDNITLRINTSDQWVFGINGVNEFIMTATALDINGNDILDIGNKIQWSTASDDIIGNAGGLEYGVGIGATHEWFVSGASQMFLNATALDLQGNDIIDVDQVIVSTRVRAIASTEIGFFVTNQTGSVGGEGTIVIPFASGSDSNKGAADSDFGAFNGAIGCYNRGGASSLLLCVRRANGNWGCKLMDLELT